MLLVVLIGGPEAGVHLVDGCLPGSVRTTTGSVYHKSGEEVYYSLEDPSRTLVIGKYQFAGN